MKKIVFLFLLALNLTVYSQRIELLTQKPDVSWRGLSVVNDKIIWVSGSAGTVGRSMDGGTTWQWMQVKGYEKTDFRDIEAWDGKQAIIMGIGEPAYILKTTDSGQHWRLVFKDETKGMFLDAMEFWNEQSGIVIGDPVAGKFFVARTFDGGYTWRGLPVGNYPVADSAEAFFAASGTNVRKLNKQQAVFVSGGSVSRLFIQDKTVELPFVKGNQTAGANSIAIKNEKIMMVTGGDFDLPADSSGNCFISFNGGSSWQPPLQAPHGYRSCVEYIGKKSWITCGINGVDYSNDEGNTWVWISKEGFHVCRKAKKGKAVFLAGSGGRIAKLIL
ncbi:MAG TPA: YCF48-related protein [Ferruginibacter sp.]|nr:YCF48-related protein [Ferruginibacter sp.]HMP21383.1 YCF48-related protein [Ferruginibacter sp.]